MTPRRWHIVLCTILVLASPAGGQPDSLSHVRLCDFESPDELKLWEFGAGRARLVPVQPAHGRSALEITFDPKGQYHPAYLSSYRLRRDWSGHDALLLDVFNPNDEPIPGSLLIADEAWAKSGRSYWNRHNSGTMFAPGRTTWVIPLGGLFRGEAGSRNNDIKRNIDINSIVRLDFGFGHKGTQGRVIIDDLRLARVSRPAGVWAFDFGPPDQSIALGWTAVSNKSGYDKKLGFGWVAGGPWDGAARDTTFGPALIRDFCEAGGYRFRVDCPPGKYRVTIIYENCGYWGGEQAQHSRRTVAVDGKQVHIEAREDGPAHSLYRFEDIEPIGKNADIWDTYMKPEIVRPAIFDATASGDGLTLKFESDRPWGSKIAALAIHRADDPDAAKWLTGQMDGLAGEFRSMAVCLDKPTTKPDKYLVLWPVDLGQDMTPNRPQRRDDERLPATLVSRSVLRGETVTFALAVRRGKERTGPFKVRFQWLRSPDTPAGVSPGGPEWVGNPLPASLCVVWYGTRRGFNSIAYRVRGHTVRPVPEELDLPVGLTRYLLVKIRVPSDAPPGAYRGKLSIHDGFGEVFVWLDLKVSPVVLDRTTDFRMGFFGLTPPGMLPADRRGPVLEQTLDMLRDSGFNMVCGGPNWKLTGWKAGQPVVDFAATDAFFALLRKHGFDGPVNGYGGLRFDGLHEGYRKGAVADKVERDSGLNYEDAFMRAWAAVDNHAREKNWPTIWYAMCDETRVRATAERELEFMKLMARASAAFPKTVRTSGAYSVSFTSRPADPNDMLHWHQRFFETLDISDLNGHDGSVLAEARKLGKDVHIYNQGTSRYAFGLYQWCESRRGVKARTQWHLNVLHGYQFFDLDGREPDTAMICYGRSGVHRTVDFERCREGVQDFYVYNTLARAAERAKQAGRTGPAIDAAAALLGEIDGLVKLNQHRPPDGFDPEALKARVIAAIEAIDAK